MGLKNKYFNLTIWLFQKCIMNKNMFYYLIYRFSKLLFIFSEHSTYIFFDNKPEPKRFQEYFCICQVTSADALNFCVWKSQANLKWSIMIRTMCFFYTYINIPFFVNFTRKIAVIYVKITCLYVCILFYQIHWVRPM